MQPTEKGPIIEIVDHRMTGRRTTGYRWSQGIHEFLEAIEGLEIQSQLSTIVSISHLSFFSLYSAIFGLTRTCGEEKERNDIVQTCNLATFNGPPNRSCQRIMNDFTAISTLTKKYHPIAMTIRAKTHAKRPSLVIPSSVHETLEFNAVLMSLEIKHQILSDVPTEDEDYSLIRAAYPRAVPSATCAAGRGELLYSPMELNLLEGYTLF
jgi:preprotein translocase subunit SecA